MHFRFLQQDTGDGIAQSLLQFMVVTTAFICDNFTNEIVINGLGYVIFRGRCVVEFYTQVYVKPHALCGFPLEIVNPNAHVHFVSAQAQRTALRCESLIKGAKCQEYGVH